MDPRTHDACVKSGPARDSGAESRRSFFRKSALAAAPAALLAAGAAEAAGSGSGRGNSQGIQIPNLYPGWNARNFDQIRADENAHAQYLQAVLGSNALPPLALNLQALAIPTTDPIFFPAFASVFENTDAATYLAATPLIQSKEILVASSSILAIEGYHAGYLNTLVDFPLTLDGQPFRKPFTLQQTLQNVMPYFANPSEIVQLANNISGTPSATNDIAILNFALALERLGSTFYNINVPRFFGV